MSRNTWTFGYRHLAMVLVFFVIATAADAAASRIIDGVQDPAADPLVTELAQSDPATPPGATGEAAVERDMAPQVSEEQLGQLVSGNNAFDVDLEQPTGTILFMGRVLDPS